MSFERIVECEPAFDKRHDDPGKDCGIHGVGIRFVLKGEQGAVQFLLYTNWHLPDVQEEMNARVIRDIQHPRVSTAETVLRCHLPMPADLGYHSPVPMYDGQSQMDCEYVEGGKCYYDGSGLAADGAYKALLEGGSDGLWKFLEEYYSETFSVTAKTEAK